MSNKQKNVLAAVLTALLAVFLGMTCNAQPGGGIQFTPPPFQRNGTAAQERELISENPKSDAENFAIRQEGYITFVSFVTASNDTLDVPLIFASWTAERTYSRIMTVYVNDIMRGYPKLTFTLHIDCDPKVTYFPTTKTTNQHD